MKIGIVGNQGTWSTERLADKVEEKTGYRLVVDLEKVSLDLEKETVFYRGQDLGELEGLIIKKVGRAYSPSHLDRLDILRYLEGRGVKVFSRPERILRLLDRLACTVTLKLAQIPMPPTVVTESVVEALEAVDRFGEAVLKPLFSTKARGMRVVAPGEDLEEGIREFKASGNDVMYIQKKVDLPGQDFGVAFLGGEYLGTYARVGHEESWNTTTRGGGRYENYEPSEDIKELAKRAQAPFELDFTSVDVAITPNGPIVFEVSAFGGFRGLLEGSGIDAAERYVDYVIKRCN